MSFNASFGYRLTCHSEASAILQKESPIERSLFSFVWKYSKRDQLKLLLVTLTLFPILYLTLELPKRIINDAVGSTTNNVTFWGIEFGQITFLALLCGLFLIAVLVHGLLKMRVNTMKGVLSERLLRRLRYTLIGRILRFPSPYFERTSQGELVSMITSEAEPMGGLMGDAYAQPMLQAGQMLTILWFLFAQSFAFGLAATALIPVQAWLIPRLQRTINQLNKKRVIEVRALASEIGETAAGAATLRMNGGWRYRLALVSDRLGRLFEVRFQIYQKKFFMKFINNLISQMTPFFFYSIGGYLAIKGEITVGALVAALAAYKDLSSPWKELLTYYNQTQDMGLRWQTIAERFAPDGIIDAKLFDGTPETKTALSGDINLKNITVKDVDGSIVLDDLTATFPAASTIAITASDAEDRAAMASLLIRELLPSSGELRIGSHNITALHQGVISGGIGLVSSTPVLFQGSLAANVNMALQTHPQSDTKKLELIKEAKKTGNSGDPIDVPWLDAKAAGLQQVNDLQDWWQKILQTTGLIDPLLTRAISMKLEPSLPPKTVAQIIALRRAVADAIEDAGLSQQVNYFKKDMYNPSLPVAENLIFAMPLVPITAQTLVDQPRFMELLTELELEQDLLQLAVDIVELLRQIFGLDGTDHPLFQRLGLNADAYEAAVAVLPMLNSDQTLSRQQKAELLAVPFVIPAEKLGTAFPKRITSRVLEMRKTHAKALQDSTKGLFAPIEFDQPIHDLPFFDNLMFGKLREGADSDTLRALVRAEVQNAGLEPVMLAQLYNMQLSLGGVNVSTVLAETIAFGRATVKRPDILILDQPLASLSPDFKDALHMNLRQLLPQTTLVFLASEFAETDGFDHQFELQNGRLSNVDGPQIDDEAQTVNADLSRKVNALQQSPLLAGLGRKQLRLLAFGARWYHAEPGEVVFRQGDDPTTGVFLVIEGTADLLQQTPGAEPVLIATSKPGDLVGELGVIRQVPRRLDMRASSDLTCLRIGAEEFLSVVEYDAATAFRVLQVVASYV